MIILAIDTSCDDTCIAILKIKNKTLPAGKQETKIKSFEILSNIVSSQVKIHQKYGGVYPALAKREHQRNLALVLKQSLSEAKLLKSKIKDKKLKTQIKIQKLEKILKREKILFDHLKKIFINYQKPKIDAIAVTIGPGLEPCLWVGVNFAKALGFFWNLKIIPVNHINAHILANLLPQASSNFQILNSKKLFPAICLIVSGGNTQLILMKNFRQYKIIGETRDDAAGECFDKTARILGLSYPGGPAIAMQAVKIPKSNIQNLISKIKLPRPMINSKDYDFSFSGLKTAVLYDFKKRPKKVKTSKKYIRKMAKEIQQSICDVLIKKTIRAAKNYKARTILLGGGVAANKELRKQFKEKIEKELSNVQYLMPNIQFCTDNAAMIGVTGYYYLLKNEIKNWKKIMAKANLRIN